MRPGKISRRSGASSTAADAGAVEPDDGVPEAESVSALEMPSSSAFATAGATTTQSASATAMTGWQCVGGVPDKT